MDRALERRPTPVCVDQDRRGDPRCSRRILPTNLRRRTLASDASLDREAEAQAFRDTFDLLAISDGEDALRKYNMEKQRFEGAFLNTSFEVIAVGLGYNVEHYKSRPEDVRPKERAKQFWSDPLFGRGFATGMSADARLARTIPRGRHLFASE